MSVVLQTTTTSTSLLAGRVGGDGGNVLNATDFHSGSSQSPEGGLCSRSRCLAPVASGGPQLDVKGGDAKGLDLFSNVLNKNKTKMYGDLKGPGHSGPRHGGPGHFKVGG